MSSANAIKLVSLLIEVTQIAAEVGVSMQDLVNRQKRAELEGREFGEADLEALRAEVDANLTDLENS